MTTDAERGPGSADADDDATDPPAGGAMRVRRWCIAANYREPSDYDIPELPDWTVYRDADGSLAFGEGGERFLSAGSPVRVRR